MLDVIIMRAMLAPKEKHDKNIHTSPHLIKRPFKNHEYREQPVRKFHDKTKRVSDPSCKGSLERHLVMSQNKKKDKKGMKVSNIL